MKFGSTNTVTISVPRTPINRAGPKCTGDGFQGFNNIHDTVYRLQVGMKIMELSNTTQNPKGFAKRLGTLGQRHTQTGNQGGKDIDSNIQQTNQGEADDPHWETKGGRVTQDTGYVRKFKKLKKKKRLKRL